MDNDKEKIAVPKRFQDWIDETRRQRIASAPDCETAIYEGLVEKGLVVERYHFVRSKQSKFFFVQMYIPLLNVSVEVVRGHKLTDREEAIRSTGIRLVRVQRSEVIPNEGSYLFVVERVFGMIKGKLCDRACLTCKNHYCYKDSDGIHRCRLKKGAEVGLYASCDKYERAKDRYIRDNATGAYTATEKRTEPSKQEKPKSVPAKKRLRLKEEISIRSQCKPKPKPKLSSTCRNCVHRIHHDDEWYCGKHMRFVDPDSTCRRFQLMTVQNSSKIEEPAQQRPARGPRPPRAKADNT